MTMMTYYSNQTRPISLDGRFMLKEGILINELLSLTTESFSSFFSFWTQPLTGQEQWQNNRQHSEIAFVLHFIHLSLENKII